MAQVRNVLRGVAQTLQAPPAEVLGALDSALARLGVDTMASAVVCQVRPAQTGASSGGVRLRWSNAGHPPPLLVHPDGTRFLAERPELLLGVDPARPRSDREVVLPPGSTVVLYTDGLVERRGQTLDDGMAHLRGVAAGLHALPPERLCDVLLERLATGAEDDVALLAVRVAG